MQYFSINTLADYGGGEYCFTDRTPVGIATRWYRLATGVEFGKDYPEDTDEVKLQLGDDYRGLKLPSFLGNTSNMLPVMGSAADIVLAHKVGRTERLPFLLLDHKGRIYSRDYVFLNPLERIECLNLERSEVRRSKKGEIKDVNRPVLDAARLERAPDVFRLGEEPNLCFFSSVVVAKLKQAACTNFVFTEVAAA
jgi:hypothetical protein